MVSLQNESASNGGSKIPNSESAGKSEMQVIALKDFIIIMSIESFDDGECNQYLIVASVIVT